MGVRDSVDGTVRESRVCRVMRQHAPGRAVCGAASRRIALCLESKGFTLVELVIATLISSLVMGIISVALGFSLRIWERQQHQAPSDMPAVIDLLKWQLATFEPQPVRIDQELVPVFKADARSLTFATAHSVKAITRGAPVVARYVFVPRDKALYYAEIPFDPYNTEIIEEFMKFMPGKDKKRRGFFSTAVAEMTFSYADSGETESFEENWQGDGAIPGVVVVTWTPDGRDRMAAAMVPNALFPKRTQEGAFEDSGLGRRQ
ncbi:MAG: prepilin-type N-terminal cleavage/methylation domain-containing protein [Syntrophobacteraceae bacterium]|nr:prepilin-type N-terminal cleavage/methylation domain-containing protein [Syntrophobacteraceae bacterium]